MQNFLNAISGRVRPILALALMLLVLVLWIGLNSLDHSGIYAALHNAVLLDAPEERVQALMKYLDQYDETAVQEKIILAVIVAMGSCIALLSQPTTDSVADIIKAVRSTEDEEKAKLRSQLAETKDKLARLAEQGNR